MMVPITTPTDHFSIEELEQLLDSWAGYVNTEHLCFFAERVFEMAGSRSEFNDIPGVDIMLKNGRRAFVEHVWLLVAAKKKIS